MPGAERAWLGLGADTFTLARLDFFDFRSAEQAGRKEDENDDQDGERGNVLVLDREIGGPERLDQADRQSAEHGAGERADATEDRGGERLDARDEAHVEI